MSGTGMDALRAAKELGLTPVLITGQPERYTGLDNADCDVVVCDTRSLPELCAVIQERYPRQEIVGLTTTSDAYLPVVAELTNWLGLPDNAADAIKVAAELAAVGALA